MKGNCLEDSTPRGPKVAASKVWCQKCTISLEVVFQGPTNTKVVSTTVDYMRKLGNEFTMLPNALTGGHGEIKQAKNLFPAAWFSYHWKVGCSLPGKNCSQQALVSRFCMQNYQYARQDVPDGIKVVWCLWMQSIAFQLGLQVVPHWGTHIWYS